MPGVAGEIGIATLGSSGHACYALALLQLGKVRCRARITGREMESL